MFDMLKAGSMSQLFCVLIGLYILYPAVFILVDGYSQICSRCDRQDLQFAL